MERNEREARMALAADLARHPGWTTDPSRNRAYNDGAGQGMALKVVSVCAAWIVAAVIWRLM